jgi:hypothetical protein
MMSRLLSRHVVSHRRACNAMREEEEPVDRRLSRRYLLPGSKVPLIVEGRPFDLHLKELSWRGLCGLTDAPVAHGQQVAVLLAGGERVEAEIRWSRAVIVGAVFGEPLSDETMERLWRRYRSRSVSARH